MPDFSGHTIASPPATAFRGGQWVLFSLEDQDKVQALKEHGAHLAQDGSLVAIHVAASWSSPVKVKRADGTEEVQEPIYQPAYLQVVQANGENLSIPVKDESGRWQVKDVVFYPTSPAIRDLRPLTDKSDIPPGRVVHPDWQPSA